MGTIEQGPQGGRSFDKIEQGPQGGRDLNKYEEVLGFKRTELEGQTVLDLGAGPGGRFAKELSAAGVHAQVVSLSPDYANEKNRQLFERTLPEKLKSLLRPVSEQPGRAAVAAWAESLPFKNESFERILALFSVSVWSEGNYKQWLPEIIRVLKSGGEARIGPFHPAEFDMYDGDLMIQQRERMHQYIAALGYEVDYIPGSEAGQTVLVLRKQRKDLASSQSSAETSQESLRRIIDRVNIDVENQRKPQLSASEYSREQFSILEKSFDGSLLEEGPSVVGVVRCWNKKEKDLAEFLERIERFKQGIPSLKGVLLIINKDGEKSGSVTEESLKAALDQRSVSIPVVPLQVEGYSWTAGLNAGAAVLNEMCLERSISRKDLRVANFSFDTDLDEEGLKQCNANIQENTLVVTARKTSDGRSPFIAGHGGGELWERFTTMLRSPKAAKLSELAYTMRNTFNVISLQDIISMGGFNPLCNGDTFSSNRPEPFLQMRRSEEVAIAGMEDIEFFMRFIFRALKKGDISALKELRTAMDTPVFYRDTSWEDLHELKKIDKIGNEMVALSLILSELSGKKAMPTQNAGETKTVGLVKDFYVPRVMQDFALRKEDEQRG
jgi:SAM-dependent methyltransferase